MSRVPSSKIYGLLLGVATVASGGGLTLFAADGGTEITNPTPKSNFAKGANIATLGNVEPARTKVNNAWEVKVSGMLLELLWPNNPGNPLSGGVLTSTSTATVTFPDPDSRKGAFNGNLTANQNLGFEHPYSILATPMDAFNVAVKKMEIGFVDQIEISDTEKQPEDGN